MKNKSDGAKSVIDKMNSATDSGLVEHVISTWVQYRKDMKKAEELEAMLNQLHVPEPTCQHHMFISMNMLTANV